MTQEKSGQVPELESPEQFTYVDDGFERLWTPHRMVYINGERPTDHAGEGCPFCSVVGQDDAKSLIVHLHQLVVPRWSGDSNFLPIIAQTKALPMLLEDVRLRLVDAWPQVK